MGGEIEGGEQEGGGEEREGGGNIYEYMNRMDGKGWMDGWVGGWVGGTYLESVHVEEDVGVVLGVDGDEGVVPLHGGQRSVFLGGWVGGWLSYLYIVPITHPPT